MPIFKKSSIFINGTEARIKMPIYVYRGDGTINVSLKIFETHEINKAYRNIDVASCYGVAHSRVCILKPDGIVVHLELKELSKEGIEFIITKDLIDEIREVGTCDFQIRLYDNEMNVMTLPCIKGGIVVKEPLCVEGEENNGDNEETGENIEFFYNENDEELVISGTSITYDPEKEELIILNLIIQEDE